MRSGHPRVRAEDVARLAGVSRVAVSRAFTPGASVAPDTREKIVRAASALGYRPNALARQLNRQSPELIAFTAGFTRNFFDAQFADRLLESLQAAGRRVLHVHVGAATNIAEALMEAMEYPVAVTVIGTGSIPREAIESCSLMAPIVLSGTLAGNPPCDMVHTDAAAGITAAIDHFVSIGRSRIGFLGGPTLYASGLERLRCFHMAMARHGLTPAFVDHADFTVEGGARHAVSIAARVPRPDAILCGNDAIAIGLLNELRHRRGVRVPQDIAIIGYDDTEPAGWPGIDLSTINNPVDQRVREICRLVARRIADRTAPHLSVAIPSELVLRATA